jgi:hypothetical protein
MPTQELPLDMEAVLPQLSRTNSLIHAVALLVLSGRMFETLSDMTDRVCARHLGANTNATASAP